MWKNYFIVAIRNLWKNKLFSGINIFGLGIAIGCSLLLFLTTLWQFSYDRFHEDSDRIYRLYAEEFHPTGTLYQSVMPAPLTPALKEEFPELEGALRWSGGGANVDYEGKILESGIRFADPDFFEVFSFRLLKGDPENVLKDLNTVVLSENMAEKIFGEADPMGKILKVNVGGGSLNLVVSGVVERRPDNSSIRYQLITRFENQPNYSYNKDRWDNNFHHVFIQLPPQFKQADFEDRLRVIPQKYLQEEMERLKRDGAIADADGEVFRYRLQALHDLRFDTKIERGGVSRALPIGLSIIGLFILAIACFNFVNLTLGGSLTRAKEVGIRKVLGASRRQIVSQFWGETVLIVGVALMVGAALAQGLLPEYNRVFRQSLNLFRPDLIWAIAVILLAIGLLGGGYPAYILSRFQAARVLQRNTSIQKPGRLRNLLVVMQFAFSVLLIICTLVVYNQINFLQEKSLGFNKEQVVSIPILSGLDSKVVINRMRSELAAYPQIKSITGSYTNFGLGEDGSRVTSKMGFEQGGHNVTTNWISVDFDFFNTLEIPIVEGRAFSREHPTDTAEAIIINETFAKQLGEGPYEGMTLNLEPERKIIGVAKDFHFASLESPIEPLSMVVSKGKDFRLGYVFVRTSGEDLKADMKLLENTWKSVAPQMAFLASFLDENNARQYQAEAAMGKIFLFASSLAILLSCIGLFGIALLTIGQRTKEIGIRKVLGASVGNIVRLTSRDFLRLVLIAFVIAAPLSWMLMNRWLETYAFHVGIQWWVFVLAGVLAVLIAFATLSFQSVRAALANPVKALRSE